MFRVVTYAGVLGNTSCSFFSFHDALAYARNDYHGLDPVWWRESKRHFQDKRAVSNAAGLRKPRDECNR